MIQTPQGRADRRAFQRAVALYTVDPLKAIEAIAIMMRLACEGVGSITRRWAAKWLEAHCGITIADDHREWENAAPPAAANL